jgi:hypothetical protein
MPDQSRADDVRWGLKWGLYIACGSTILALIGTATGEAVEGRLVVQLVGLYFLSGLTAGAIIGALRSRLDSRLGAAMTGVLAALPVVAGLCVLAWGPPWHWSGGLMLAWLIFSVYTGLLATFVFRKLHMVMNGGSSGFSMGSCPNRRSGTGSRFGSFLDSGSRVRGA